MHPDARADYFLEVAADSQGSSLVVTAQLFGL
jgi:hypothetical protein